MRLSSYQWLRPQEALQLITRLFHSDSLTFKPYKAMAEMAQETKNETQQILFQLVGNHT